MAFAVFRGDVRWRLQFARRAQPIQVEHHAAVGQARFDELFAFGDEAQRFVEAARPALGMQMQAGQLALQGIADHPPHQRRADTPAALRR
jgi:hypothetical protein